MSQSIRRKAYHSYINVNNNAPLLI